MPREKGKSRVVSDSSSSSSSSSEGQQVVPGRRRRPDHRSPSFKEREPARSSRGDRHERETSGYLGDRHERHEPRSSNMERVSYKKDSESQSKSRHAFAAKNALILTSKLWSCALPLKHRRNLLHPTDRLAHLLNVMRHAHSTLFLGYLPLSMRKGCARPTKSRCVLTVC